MITMIFSMTEEKITIQILKEQVLNLTRPENSREGESV